MSHHRTYPIFLFIVAKHICVDGNSQIGKSRDPNETGEEEKNKHATIVFSNAVVDVRAMMFVILGQAFVAHLYIPEIIK
jgi:hypothetical protein